MALKSAPHLIRQKATFGTELTDHADQLARLLMGMQDSFDMEGFQEMRLAGLVAVVAGAPDVVEYIVETFFSGDLSIQQRLILLSALGLGARDLADLDKKVRQMLFSGC
jgi:telomere length regulation protein